MRQQREPRIERDGKTTQFLSVEESWGVDSGIEIGQSKYRVTHYEDVAADCVIFGIRSGALHYSEHLTPEEARLLGRALLLAADEVEAAQVAEAA